MRDNIPTLVRECQKDIDQFLLYFTSEQYGAIESLLNQASYWYNLGYRGHAQTLCQIALEKCYMAAGMEIK